MDKCLPYRIREMSCFFICPGATTTHVNNPSDLQGGGGGRLDRRLRHNIEHRKGQNQLANVSG